MYNEDIVTLSNYRLEQAKDNLEEAIVLFENNKYKGASLLFYFSCSKGSISS